MNCLCIGLDGACQPVLRRLFEDGATPALERLFERDVSGVLESQIPPWTPSAWPSLYTGTNPGKHGLFDFLVYDGYDWEVVDATHLRERPVWEYLSLEGYTSVVVNAPVTHPPAPFDGALVPGYTAPEDPPCHPAGILDDVRDAVGDYRIYPPRDATGDDALLAARLDLVRSRGEAFGYLADRFDPDFGFLQFQQTDTVFHQRPGDWEAVRAIYRAVDDEVGAVLDRCDPDTVFVVSDHGIGPYERYEFRVNEFLRDHGYVTARRGGDGRPSWGAIRETRLRSGEDGGRERVHGLLERAMSHAARLGLTTQRIVPVLDALSLREAAGRLVPQSVAEAGAERVDFRASTAYMRSRSELGVRINLEGREPNGQVPPDDYEAVRTDLVELLSSVTTPDGDRVFGDVARREKYFHGPMTGHAVDVVTVPDEFEQFVSARLGADTFGPPSEPWNHKREGVLSATGVAIDADAEVADATIFDVAPTLLATFGLPRAARMDGRCLPIIGSTGAEQYEPYTPPDVDRSDGGSDPRVVAQLSDLGYL